MENVMDRYESMDKQPKRININDVRDAVEQLGGNPGCTNAMAVRKVLGSGGFNTIQKHLETLRKERKNTETEKYTETAPKDPEELIQEMWSAAFEEAARRQGTALTDALRRAEELNAELQTSLNDKIVLVEALDRVQAERDEAIKRADTAEHALEIERKVIVAEKVTLGALIEQVKLMIRSSD